MKVDASYTAYVTFPDCNGLTIEERIENEDFPVYVKYPTTQQPQSAGKASAVIVAVYSSVSFQSHRYPLYFFKTGDLVQL